MGVAVSVLVNRVAPVYTATAYVGVCGMIIVRDVDLRQDFLLKTQRVTRLESPVGPFRLSAIRSLPGNWLSIR